MVTLFRFLFRKARSGLLPCALAVLLLSSRPLLPASPLSFGMGMDSWQTGYSKLAPGDAAFRDHLFPQTSAFGNRFDMPPMGDLRRASAVTFSVSLVDNVRFEARNEKMGGDPDNLSFRPDLSLSFVGIASYRAERSSAGLSMGFRPVSLLSLHVRGGLERNALSVARNDIAIPSSGPSVSEGLSGHAVGAYGGAGIAIPLRFLSDVLPEGMGMSAFADILRSTPLRDGGTATFHSMQADGSWETGQAGMRLERLRASCGLSASFGLGRPRESGPRALTVGIGWREDRTSYRFPGYAGLNQNAAGVFDSNELVTDHMMYGASSSAQRLAGAFASASVTFLFKDDDR